MDKDLMKMNLQYFAENPDQTDNSGDETETTTETVEEKTFTQEQMTGIAAKEAKLAQEKLLKQLGVEDMESAKDGLAKYQEHLESQKTEQDKVNEALESVTTERDTLQSQYSALEAENTALKQGVLTDSVDDVVALAQSKVSDEVTIEQAIKEIVEKYPNFVAQVEEQEEVPDKPRIVSNEQPNGSSGKVTDAFKAAANKYI